MTQPLIFISCGQYDQAERNLGEEIAEIVRKSGFTPFFAQDVQDLNGLDTNILNALRDCVGFITVLHPRGEITRPDNSTLTRASVWIEQEIAIVTYIQRVEGRQIPTIAFKHESVDREGIRDVIQLNPINFKHESEIVVTLRERLKLWLPGSAATVRLELKSTGLPPQGGHPIRRLEVVLFNDSNERIENYDFELRLPAGILKHWSGSYTGEVPCEPDRRCFRLDHRTKGPLSPHSNTLMFGTEYCKMCAGRTEPLLAGGLWVDATVWIAGREHREKKTIEEIEKDAGK